MTTSGNYSFELMRNRIIELAYRDVGAYTQGQTLTDEQYSIASDILNAMVQNWRADNVFLWEEEWITQQFTESSIVLGDDGIDYQCILNHISTTNTRPVSGNQWIPYWKKLETSSGTPWVVDTPYTFIGNFSLDPSIVGIKMARIFQSSGQFEQFLLSMTEEMYFTLGDISVSGKPTQYFYRRQPTPQVYLYPAPNNATDYAIQLAVYRYTQTVDNPSDKTTFLNEWMMPLYKGLAVQLAPGEGIPPDRFGVLKKEFKDAYDIAKQLDHESGPVDFQPMLHR